MKVIRNGTAIELTEDESECALYDLWGTILASLPTDPEEVLLDHRQHIKLWTNGDEILGKNEDSIDGIADLFEAIGFDVNTGYYDPVEDERNHEVDRNTGYYYATIFGTR